MIPIKSFSEISFAEWYENYYCKRGKSYVPYRKMLNIAVNNYGSGRAELRHAYNYYMRWTCSSFYSEEGFYLHQGSSDIRKEFIIFLYSGEVGDYVEYLLRTRCDQNTDYQSITHDEKKNAAITICEMYLRENKVHYMPTGYHPREDLDYIDYYKYADTIFEFIAEIILTDSIYSQLKEEKCLQAYDTSAYVNAVRIFKSAIDSNDETSINSAEYTKISRDSFYKYYVWWRIKQSDNYRNNTVSQYVKSDRQGISESSEMVKVDRFVDPVVRTRNRVIYEKIPHTNKYVQNSVEPEVMSFMRHILDFKSVDVASQSEATTRVYIPLAVDPYDLSPLNKRNFFMELITGLFRRGKARHIDQDRYNQISYKCFILLGLAESKLYKSLITGDNYKSLHNETGDYLDIYYSDSADVSEAVDIILKHKSKGDNDVAMDSIPCIYLCKDGLDNGRAISVKGLDCMRIIDVIRSIVGGIQKDLEFDQIVTKANECSKGGRQDMKDEKGLTINNSGILFNNVNAGDISVNDVTIDNSNYSMTQEADFGKQLEAFFGALESVDEMNDAQKENLKQNLQGLKDATDSKDETKQEIKKEVLKSAFTQMTKQVVEKLLSVAAAAGAPLVVQLIQCFVK